MSLSLLSLLLLLVVFTTSLYRLPSAVCVYCSFICLCYLSLYFLSISGDIGPVCIDGQLFISVHMAVLSVSIFPFYSG